MWSQSCPFPGNGALRRAHAGTRVGVKVGSHKSTFSREQRPCPREKPRRPTPPVARGGAPPGMWQCPPLPAEGTLPAAPPRALWPPLSSHPPQTTPEPTAHNMAPKIPLQAHRGHCRRLGSLKEETGAPRPQTASDGVLPWHTCQRAGGSVLLCHSASLPCASA